MIFNTALTFSAMILIALCSFELGRTIGKNAERAKLMPLVMSLIERLARRDAENGNHAAQELCKGFDALKTEAQSNG